MLIFKIRFLFSSNCSLILYFAILLIISFDTHSLISWTFVNYYIIIDHSYTACLYLWLSNFSLTSFLYFVCLYFLSIILFDTKPFKFFFIHVPSFFNYHFYSLLHCFLSSFSTLLINIRSIVLLQNLSMIIIFSFHFNFGLDHLNF